MMSINTDERLITMRMALMGLLASNRVFESCGSAAIEAKDYADALLQVYRETSESTESPATDRQHTQHAMCPEFGEIFP